MTDQTNFLARLFNVRAVTAGPVTVIYDRGWLGELCEVWRTRVVWVDCFHDDNAVGVQLGPLTFWLEVRS